MCRDDIQKDLKGLKILHILWLKYLYSFSVEGRLLTVDIIKCWKIFHSKCGMCPEDIIVLARSCITCGHLTSDPPLSTGTREVHRFKITREIFPMDCRWRLIALECCIYLEFLTRQCCCSWNSGEFSKGHSLLLELKIVLFRLDYFVWLFTHLLYYSFVWSLLFVCSTIFCLLLILSL